MDFIPKMHYESFAKKFSHAQLEPGAGLIMPNPRVTYLESVPALGVYKYLGSEERCNCKRCPPCTQLGRAD